MRGVLTRLGGMRSRAESLMSDTFTAYAPNGDFTVVDGIETPDFDDKGSVLGRVRVVSRVETTPARFVTIGGVERPVVEGGLRIPVSAPVPDVGWEYQMTAPGPMTDPALAGRRWRVMGEQADSFGTARRLNVVEVPAP